MAEEWLSRRWHGSERSEGQIRVAVRKATEKLHEAEDLLQRRTYGFHCMVHSPCRFVLLRRVADRSWEPVRLRTLLAVPLVTSTQAC